MPLVITTRKFLKSPFCNNIAEKFSIALLSVLKLVLTAFKLHWHFHMQRRGGHTPTQRSWCLWKYLSLLIWNLPLLFSCIFNPVIISSTGEKNKVSLFGIISVLTKCTKMYNSLNLQNGQPEGLLGPSRIKPTAGSRWALGDREWRKFINHLFENEPSWCPASHQLSFYVFLLHGVPVLSMTFSLLLSRSQGREGSSQIPWGLKPWRRKGEAWHGVEGRDVLAKL